ncbi:MAG: exosortase family protein XrtG [Liquorilactobacillus ghanensis]|uniref:exosortase family protein XrtG n=1 Tax=Liquorilactobacillus ghanensis TaxID=399370 RepID=UPI0039EC293B
MNIYLIISSVVWLYILSLLKRAKLTAFFFIWGSIGLFFILMALSNPYWIWFATHLVIKGTGWIGTLTDMSHTMIHYNIISILNPTDPINMSIDYECSGIIETLAFLSLVVFFPIFDRHEKLFFGILGIFWIYLANVIRLLLIISLIHFFGGQYFFVVHSILGRIVFYVLAITLYYNVFTYSQLVKSVYSKWQKLISRTQI